MSEQPDPPIDRCESCGWGALGVLLVDFRDGGPVFLVCDSCGQLAADIGARVTAAPDLSSTTQTTGTT
ncbi:hypothetical protein [Phycicoccus jejuensis]|uniref:hypothetical protein n=1 Tax=Phycicoccus jejuensis TaxID=367299 RepID=UPI0004C479D8|nr:hypothetical protein [Phycicoccus jejuensis]